MANRLSRIELAGRYRMTKPPPSAPPPAGILLYQTEDGQTRLEVTQRDDTVWLALNQLAELLQCDKSVISKHINNIFDEGELSEAPVVACSATTAANRQAEQFGASAPQPPILWQDSAGQTRHGGLLAARALDPPQQDDPTTSRVAR